MCRGDLWEAFANDLLHPTLDTVTFIWGQKEKHGELFFRFPIVLGTIGCRFAWKIDGYLPGDGVKFAQKMAPNGLRENQKLQRNMSVTPTR